MELKFAKLLSSPINEEFVESATTHAINALHNAGIFTLFDLVQKTDQDLLMLRNFGKGALRSVKDALRDRGLTLGMNVASGQIEPSDLHEARVEPVSTMTEEMKSITMILEVLLPMPINQRDRVMRTIHCWLSPGTIKNVICQ